MVFDSAVNVFPRAQAYNKHTQLKISNFADDAEVTDSVAPKLPERATERLPESSNILGRRNTFVDEVKNAAGSAFV